MSSLGSSGGGGNFTAMLTTLFIGLKLTNQIDWCWFLVLLPMILKVVIELTVRAIVDSKKSK